MPEPGEVLQSGLLSDLLVRVEEIGDAQTEEGYYELYVPKGVQSLKGKMKSAIIFTPDFVDDDWLPEYAIEHGLEAFYEIALMQDVILSVREQKARPTVAELIAALNYFNQYDAFMNLTDES